ncbi:MAG: hypothetical protein DMG21_13385 [Acidobacteria bacterium]|nr:MAG: hypothetical protein DMG21_13385 [Acidobacteriota bacterium]
MTAKASFVPCKILPGFFDSEVYVVVLDSSAYVSLEHVKLDGNEKALQEGKEVDGFVLAYIVAEDPQKGKVLVEVPGEPVIGGLRAWVPQAQLRPV